MDEMANVSLDHAPECRLLRPEDVAALGHLFDKLRTQGVEKFFHPHPLTREEAGKRAAYAGKDVYCVLQIGADLAGYGMLRGWDEGYEIPSLGIAVDPTRQGSGHGRRLMEFLHAVALQRGARQVRLRVYPENARAVRLYEALGYSFGSEVGGQIVGIVELNPGQRSSSEEGSS
jgi:[ribosomal protein S18]-alanine N-acetyltransferase